MGRGPRRSQSMGTGEGEDEEEEDEEDKITMGANVASISLSFYSCLSIQIFPSSPPLSYKQTRRVLKVKEAQEQTIVCLFVLHHPQTRPPSATTTHTRKKKTNSVCLAVSKAGKHQRPPCSSACNPTTQN